MGKVTLVLGGVRSGKSAFALACAEKEKGEKKFFATAEARDAEMRERISRHRESRPPHWITVEMPLDLIGGLKKEDRPESIVVIDCLTLWLSNLLEKRKKDPYILVKVDHLAETLSRFSGRAWLVSNEVGLGVVPATALGRRFRDLSGQMN
ncbi:MAG TPA: bifunctional adenosylcobinamide kinase/adenosylcobinamide-phosphate guanylyltransferase, partial [Candidatus Manganitrophaceae bacterium]|nr:bifunctional adenosylcobinamide kinase/adenosylcobinamide-phosphate guanylyltransferase [Candidatus Manganitrophaceae bacterium]